MTAERAAILKVRRRLIPFLFILYVVSYLDRINVGFAALQMNQDLGFSDVVYGLGAGIFFLSYVAFEVPSNLILERVGVRIWIARIMISWGFVSAAMMFVQGPASFYALRFLLGAAEAGFFPGMILYLTRWFPAPERARAIALFMTATALAGVVGGPISGALLQMHGFGGLEGWQWLFLLEGLPAVALGFCVLAWLPERPRDATWLTPDERALIERRVAEDQAVVALHGHKDFGAAARSPHVWRFALLYFTLVVALYGISFWLPQILRSLNNVGEFAIGVLSAGPYVVAAGGMLVVARLSDLSGERRLYVAGPALIGAAGFVGTALVTDPVLSLVCLSVAAFGVWSSLGPFWTLPASMLTGSAAAGGVALINSVGNVGGFVGPYAVGWVRQTTGSFASGMFLLAGMLVLGAIIAMTTSKPAAIPAARNV
jgi:ACS family tartrate transporter-like MFS transporter